MQTFLTIDQGNSSVKIAVWHGLDLVEQESLNEVSRQQLAKLVDRYKPERALVCSVTGNGKRYVQWLESQGLHASEVSLDMPLPIKINYSSTLGADRIAAAAGAWSLLPGCDILVVDMGSAVTYDFVNRKGEFEGGNIAPGIGMRLRSLHNYTARLPELNGYGDTPLLGHDTATAMRAGAVRGVVAEICYYISQLPEGTRVVLTGGWSNHVSTFLPFQALVDKCLVTKGLLSILLNNEN